MRSAKLVIGGAAATALGIRVARSLYSRWRVLPDPHRRRIEPLAEALKARALDVRGAPNPSEASRDLDEANRSFAAALVETAEANPEIDDEEVRQLREELRRELERLASADIKAWRIRGERSTRPG
jgi:hypothetical protein